MEQLFTALGLDWRNLAVNAAAFLAIVWIMARFVYPTLVRALDTKQADLEAAERYKREAEKAMRQAQASAAGAITKARATAGELLDAARADAAKLVKDAEAKASSRADRIISDARQQLDRDVANAQQALKVQTAQLLAEAAGVVLDEKLDKQHDEALLIRSLEGR
ncbi:MAG TPA: hypothetical protein VLF67_04540 [Candidatus Saccharimonas sp.]|nr:hypothetical protein [Candidatus Saccharimonas sp.]